MHCPHRLASFCCARSDQIAILTSIGRSNATPVGSVSAALTDALADSQTSPVRVVVLAAHCPAFSAGHDMKEMDGHGGALRTAGPSVLQDVRPHASP